MKLFSCAIAACSRYFNTRTTTKSTYWTQSSFKKKNKNKENESTNPKRTRTIIKWTDQQSQVLDAISNGKSVFITGSAGTGKTILLRHIIKQLKRIHGQSRVYVTASTAVAACALHGQTLHSFSGIGFGDADHPTLSFRVYGDNKAYRRWTTAKALVIDEISMVDADLFDNLERISREIRGDEDYASGNTIWGGIQLVVSGDFLQLPPVITRQKTRTKEFAFEAECWNASFDMQVELTRVFRQSESQFIKLLQDIRRGESDPEDLQLLEQRCSETEPNASVVRLYPRIEDVNRVNKKQMESLGE